MLTEQASARTEKTVTVKEDLTVVSYQFEALNSMRASTVALIDAFIEL